MFHTLQAKSKQELHIRLFGAVGQWELINANFIARLLSQAKADGYEHVKFLLHCPGGQIFEGIPVNTIVRNAGIKTTIEVHGVACSWGAVMLQSADRRGMVQGTRLMIHQGHGGIHGSSAQIINYGNLLGTLNVDIAAILADTTGKDKDWILENWMAEGMDKWFTAEEALKEKLIDYIVPNTKQKDKAAAYTSMEDLAAFYDQTLLQTNERKMNKEQLAKLGLDENATQEQIDAAIEALLKNQKEDTAGDASASAAGGDNAKASALVMKMAEKAGFITDKNKESFTKLAALDPGAAMDLIPEGANAGAQAHASVSDLIKQIKANSGAGKKPEAGAKKYSEMSEAELKALEDSDPAAFEALFNAEYGDVANPQN